jgi:hypothetical protein
MFGFWSFWRLRIQGNTHSIAWLFCFLGGTRVWTQNFLLGRCSITWTTLSAHFLCWVFWDRVLKTICPGWQIVLNRSPLISASLVAKIIGMCHWCLATQSHSLNDWPWAHHFISLDFIFLIYKVNAFRLYNLSYLRDFFLILIFILFILP